MFLLWREYQHSVDDVRHVVPRPEANGEAPHFGRMQRRNAVIVAAESVGYGRMMVHDDGGAIYALADVWRVIDPMIVAFGCRILGIAGESYAPLPICLEMA